MREIHLGFFSVLTDEMVFLWLFQTALDIRQSVFGGKNIHVATAHEDLAYSSYVHQYSSGKFDNALWVQLLEVLAANVDGEKCS